MLIWQSHVNANTRPCCMRRCYPGGGRWEVMGPVVKRPPQTGPKQPAGGIEEAPCCTDWPDSSDSSGEDRLSAGRWEEGYLSSSTGTPSSLHHPAKPLTLSLSLPISPHVFAVSLSRCLSSAWLLLPGVPGDVWKVMLSTLGLELEQLPGFRRPFSPDRHYSITDCSCFSCFFSPCDPVKIINWRDGYCMWSCAGSYPSFTVFQINNLSPLIFLSNIIGLPAGHYS